MWLLPCHASAATAMAGGSGHLRVWECRTWNQSCRTCGNQPLWLVVTPPGRGWWPALPLVDRPSTRHPGMPDLTHGENATFYTFPIIMRKCGFCVTGAAFLASGMRRALIVSPSINPAEKRPADIAVSTARHELFPRSCARRDAVPVMRARVIQPWQTAFNNLAIVAPPPPKTPRRATRGCF